MNSRSLIMNTLIIILLAGVGAAMFRSYQTRPSENTTSIDNTSSAGAQTDTLTNNTKNVDTTAQGGVKIEVIGNGTGPEAKKGDSIAVEYTGKLTDGKVFDSSVGRAPFTLTLGEGHVIPGWEIGLLGMKVGEKRRLTIPPELAYGKNGFPGAIPPDATLIFDVELKAIK